MFGSFRACFNSFFMAVVTLNPTCHPERADIHACSRPRKKGVCQSDNWQTLAKALSAELTPSALKRRGFPRLQVAYLPDS